MTQEGYELTWPNRCERKVQSIDNGQVEGKGGISNKPAQLNRLALTKCNPVGIAQLAGKEGMWIEPTWSNKCERKVQSIDNGQVEGKGGISNKPAQLNRLALTKCIPVGIAQLAEKAANQLDPVDVNAKCNPLTMDKWKGRVAYQTNQLNSTDLRLQNATQWVLHNWQGRQRTNLIQ